ncbi:hypothetical protein ACIBTV_27290 [Micromonospora sp. NPDC049366]|uniref:hypothetical protein n=1 Tax=Micromonospora sp. NPDC049366 TaxID=3364271 RepID=UPI00379DA1FA
MYAFSINYRERDGKRSPRLHRGFWVHSLPRLMLACRLLGHRPVVDGTQAVSRHDTPARWVVCDRCGVRGEPQGSLNAQRWNIGDRYTGPWSAGQPDGVDDAQADAAGFGAPRQVPGPLPKSSTGSIGGEVAVGHKDIRIVGFSLKVGNAGSEHTLAAALHLWWGSLYLHTERFGTWLQRRLNPTGYESRVIELEAFAGRIWWKLWARRDSSSASDPRWQRGNLQIDPRTLLLGPKRYAYADVGAKVTETVYLPDGEQHPVVLQLQRRAYGRKRWRKRESWSAAWEAPRGLPTKAGNRGRVYGSAVDVSDMAVASGLWPAAARARICDWVIRERTRNGWKPSAEQRG